LPHRYPFLLVDRVVELSEERIVCLKNVTANEPHFQGHFPDHPIMPGVLIIEALAQAGGLYALSHLSRGGLDPKSKLMYFMGIDKAKFRRPVVPGDQLRLEVTPLRKGGTIWKMRGQALVDGQLAAEAEFLASLVDR
jgi:beta-hydroxyacyl-ACP dehydratase FabZ